MKTLFLVTLCQMLMLNISMASICIPDSNLRKSIMRELGKLESEPITDSDMKSLKAIVVTNVNDLTGLELAKNLQSLLMAKSNMTDISELKHLTNLIYLVIIDMPIKDISTIAGLPEINSILLHGTQVSDIAPLVENENLGKDSFIMLDDNPLSYASQHIHIPRLMKKGVKLSYTPKHPLYDLNTDGKVSVLDMILVAKAIANDIRGEDIPEDVNRDRVVDIKDIEIISNNLSK